MKTNSVINGYSTFLEAIQKIHHFHVKRAKEGVGVIAVFGLQFILQWHKKLSF